jgi:hypothetical protein
MQHIDGMTLTTCDSQELLLTEESTLRTTAEVKQERPIALLSLPNTGTDWFVDLYLRQNPSLRYYREFFNPICNPTYENELRRAFGCEMVDSYQLIAKVHCPHQIVYQQTWMKESYNFTKENYSAFKLDWYSSQFDCFVLYRRAERTLPGSRIQVKAWYDAMYCSLLRNRWTLSSDVRLLIDFAADEADTLAKRQVAAFVIYYYQMLMDAHRLEVRVLDYDLLMQSSIDQLRSYLHGLPGVVDAEKLAADVCSERLHGQKDFASLQASDFFARLCQRTRKYGGDRVALLTPLAATEITESSISERVLLQEAG